MAYICVASGGKTPDGDAKLTPDCASAIEIDSAIADLIQELNDLRQESRKKFEAERRKKMHPAKGQL